MLTNGFNCQSMQIQLALTRMSLWHHRFSFIQLATFPHNDLHVYRYPIYMITVIMGSMMRNLESLTGSSTRISLSWHMFFDCNRVCSFRSEKMSSKRTYGFFDLCFAPSANGRRIDRTIEQQTLQKGIFFSSQNVKISSAELCPLIKVGRKR